LDILDQFILNDELILENRIVMAPLTRCFADKNLVPTDLMKEYYSRRADAGLIISEAAIINKAAQGYPNTPGIYSDDQINGWQKITDAIHDKGGKIFCQLWHVGRISHSIYQRDNNLPLAPSALRAEGRVSRTELDFETPKAMTIREIDSTINDYKSAALNAMKAGFDGVEIHAANGYLIDQFIHAHTNRREDIYGDDKTLFCKNVISAVTEVVDSKRVGIRLSPGAYMQQTNTPGDEKSYKEIFSFVENKKLAYIHTGIFDDSEIFPYLGGTATEFIRENYSGTLIACGGHTAQSAEKDIKLKKFDLVAIGRSFIANPDYVSKIKNDEPLSEYNPEMLKELY
jgi:2,4-dienoyl-CoA reductase-like NADH-dependent reductase (Old Yellow Enzyme family)